MQKIIAVFFTLTSISCGYDHNLESNLDLFQERNIFNFELKGTYKVALTFDDGPSKHTPRLLRILEEHGIPATFFVLGKTSRQNTALLEAMARQGHVIANHSATHRNLRNISSHSSTLIEEIKSIHDIIYPFVNGRLYFRAPYGAWRSSHAGVLNSYPELAPYIGPIFWNIGGEVRFRNGHLVAAADWDCWHRGYSSQKCLGGYLRETESQKGGVILMHDVTSKTVDMVKAFLPTLEERGYSFVTLDDLQSLDQYE